MKAVCWHGRDDVRVENVPDPTILNPRDAVVKVKAAAICGSDLHLLNGFIPSMRSGDILGHEFMGEVVEVGPEVRRLVVGDRVVVPFPIACGSCEFCRAGLTAACDNTNPNAWMAEKIYGYSPGGIFGYSHMLGGYAGGQAEYVRVPFADIGPVKLPASVSDEQAVMLADIFPTGYFAAENCTITPGQVVAVWGCGPVGQFAIRSALMLGAERVIAIDDVPERLDMASREERVEVVNRAAGDVLERIREASGGRGPDACIDAVGMEAHETGIEGLYDRAKQAVRLETDRPHVLREVIQACRKGGTVSLAGVYGGFVDKFPIGAAFNKGLTLKMGQTHVHRYIAPLLERVERGEIDPSFVVTHHVPLDSAPAAYQTFKRKEDGCIKVVLRPDGLN